MFLKSKAMVVVACRVLFGIVLTTLAVHLTIVLITMFGRHESHRVKLVPRYAERMELKSPGKIWNGELGDTYLDALQNHRRLRAESIDRHLEAGRDMLDKSSKTRDIRDDYVNIQGDESGFPFQCTSCALVGISGDLLYSKMGRRIDQSSCVFRLDLAPVRGFEKDVGMKTTARITHSSRLYPFLKKPKKLISGPHGSDKWFLFDRRNGDITRLYSKLLPLIQKDRSIGFYWFSRKAEIAAMQSLKYAGQQLQMKLMGAHPETLWYAVEVMKDAGCQFFEIFGIPDPRICKRDENIETGSRYWDHSSPGLCFGGQDAGNVLSNSKMSAEVTTLSDRRALLSWVRNKSNVIFEAPPWPESLFS